MNFSNQIAESFHFMCNWGYQKSFSSNNIVQYNNDRIIIEILYNDYAFELEAYFVLINECKKISLNEFLVYLGINKKGIYQISNTNKLDIGLNYISDSIKQVLDVINGKDFDMVNKAIAFVENNRQTKLFEMERKSEFDKAEIFWKNKNYQEVKRIYMKYAKDLPNLYKKRLTYINSHMDTGDSSLC